MAIVNGIATFTPTADWNGSEALTFTATDPSGESVSQTVNFTVAPVADIVADKATVVEDTPTIIKVLEIQSGFARTEILIVNAAECEPYITSDDKLMQEHAEELIQGIEIVEHILTSLKLKKACNKA